MAASRTSRVRVQARFVANVAVNHHVNSRICTLFLKELLRDNHACVALKAWGFIVIKSQLTLKVAENFLRIRNSVVERAVNVVLDEIVAAMTRKDRVELRAFGAFYSKDRGRRIAQNPKSDVKVEVPDKNVPAFRPSKEIGKCLNLVVSVSESSEQTSRRTP